MTHANTGGRAHRELSVRVLGCCGSYPGPGRACSAYLVQAGHTAVAVDLGNGSLANLQQHLPLDELDAVVLTHAHPDHWVDLAGLEVALTFDHGVEDFPVYGTHETRHRAEVLLDDFTPTIGWHEVRDGDEVRVGPLRFDFSRTVHYVETLAVRVTFADDPYGPSLAYSADTGPGWSFAAFHAPVDLAICEATFGRELESEGIQHLSARQAGAMAAESGVDRLVITHLYPGVDPDAARREASEAFGRPVQVATEHAVFTV